jgi:hypothetical protein
MLLVISAPRRRNIRRGRKNKRIKNKNTTIFANNICLSSPPPSTSYNLPSLIEVIYWGVGG